MKEVIIYNLGNFYWEEARHKKDFSLIIFYHNRFKDYFFDIFQHHNFRNL